jgi:thiol-disulfide isomerase/thioredoxin
MRKLVLLLLLVASPLKAEIYDIGQLDLESQTGKVVYLDFWASWCKPCRESFPWMNSLLTRYPDDRFTIITVNLDAETAEMHRFLEKIPADFDIYHDPSGAIAEQFQLEGMPTSYLIDANGKVVRRHIGFYTRKIEEYEREIEELL